MDHIAQQLKAEIESLRDYIQRTEDCLQVTGWVEELVDSFEPLEEKFSEPELHKVLHALCTAKFHFCVNGHLSQRIDGILERHQDLVANLRTGKEDPSSSWPAKDPESYADISQEDDEERNLFIGEEDPSSFPLPTIADTPQTPAQEGSLFQAGNFDELPNEEEPDISSLWAVGDDTDSQAPARNGSLFRAPDLDPSWDDKDDTQTPVFHAPDLDALPCDDAEEEGAQALFSSDGEDSAEYTQPHPTSPDAVMPDENLEELFPPSFSASQQNQPAEKAPPQPDEKEDELFESLIPPRQSGAAGPPATKTRQEDPSEDSPDDLLADGLSTATRSGIHSQSRIPSDRPRTRLPVVGKTKTPQAQRFILPATPGTPEVDLFNDKISLEELSLRLDITIPAQDLTQLQNLLHQKIADRVIAALRTHTQFENKLILIPRLSRFIHAGELYPCTVKNLAKNFINLFGNLRDLLQYRNQPFFHLEVPTLGWALITREAPRESLDKNFMEQTQYLRYLAASMGIPSHLVRRRTLIEALYDIIVGRMVLDDLLHKHTLDWTSSGVSKSNFVCIYFSDKGIRMRDLPRTTHNRSLGAVPNW